MEWGGVMRCDANAIAMAMWVDVDVDVEGFGGERKSELLKVAHVTGNQTSIAQSRDAWRQISWLQSVRLATLACGDMTVY